MPIGNASKNALATIRHYKCKFDYSNRMARCGTLKITDCVHIYIYNSEASLYSNRIIQIAWLLYARRMRASMCQF